MFFCNYSSFITASICKICSSVVGKNSYAISAPKLKDSISLFPFIFSFLSLRLTPTIIHEFAYLSI